MSLSFNIDPSRLSRLVDQESFVRMGLFRPQYPPLAVEVGEGRLTLAHVQRERKKQPAVHRYRTVDLPPSSLSVQFGRANLQNAGRVGKALQDALEAEEIDTREISLVLPDHLARVSLIHLGEKPASRAETLEMIRWKLRKAVPFRIEDAHIDYQIFTAPNDSGAFTCLATLMQQSVLDQYEKLFRDLDLHAGLIDLSTFALVNLYLSVLEREEGDAFVLNVTGSFFVLLILRAGVPLFYRAKSFAFVDEASEDSRQHLVVREVSSSVSYYRERLAGDAPRRLFVRCVDLDCGRLHATLQQKIGAEVVSIDPSNIIRITGSGASGDRAGMLQQIAPAVGAALGREL